MFHYESPLGGINLERDGDYLTELWFGEAQGVQEEELPIFKETVRWLDMYFGGEIPDFTPPISMSTTDFRKEVWEIMLTIPFGETMSYGDIAKEIAKKKGIEKMSAQAVGGAVGHNSIPIIIPCHRVIGSDGSLTGYSAGIEKKIWLLDWENKVRK